jgi:hypothetical protein
MQCSNNLKQIGIALHTYHDTFKVFPPAKLGSGSKSGNFQYPDQFVANTTGWALMLPQLEQQAIANQYNYGLPSSLSNFSNVKPFINGATSCGKNIALVSNRLEIMTCPSDTYPSNKYSVSPGVVAAYESNNAARSNYLFNTGHYTDYDVNYSDLTLPWAKGVFGNDGAAGLQDCTDGTSNTVAVGESKQGNRGKQAAQYGPFWGSGSHTCCHGRTVSSQPPGHVSWTTVTVLAPVAPKNQSTSFAGYANWAPNFDYGNNGSGQQYAWQFGSYHPNICLFVMCDGAVKAFPNSTDYNGVFVWLCRPNENMAVSTPAN